MGILDSRTRFVDSIITQEGRRQISSGRLKPEFYSFSDAGAVYSLADTFVSGTGDLSEDIATIIAFEAGNLPQDRVTFEANDAGGLVVREFMSVDGKTIRVLDGQLFSGTLGSGSLVRLTSSAEFASLANGLLSSSINNFNNLSILGSPDLLNNKKAKFELARQSIKFTITDDAPILSQENGGTQESDVNHVESLFADKRLSHVPNFQFLPPVNKPRTGTRITYPIGNFPRVGQAPILSYADLQKELSVAATNGFSESVKFTFTSDASRVFGQFFEVAGAKLTKLDVIDFGLFTVGGNQTTQDEFGGSVASTKHVFFVGKIYVDDNDSHTFINIFTLVFE